MRKSYNMTYRYGNLVTNLKTFLRYDQPNHRMAMLIIMPDFVPKRSNGYSMFINRVKIWAWESWKFVWWTIVPLSLNTGVTTFMHLSTILDALSLHIIGTWFIELHIVLCSVHAMSLWWQSLMFVATLGTSIISAEQPVIYTTYTTQVCQTHTRTHTHTQLLSTALCMFLI